LSPGRAFELHGIATIIIVAASGGHCEGNQLTHGKARPAATAVPPSTSTEVPVARLVAFCLQHQRFLPLDGTLYMAHHTIYARLVPVPKIALFQYSTVLVDIYYPC